MIDVTKQHIHTRLRLFGLEQHIHTRLRLRFPYCGTSALFCRRCWCELVPICCCCC
jgi:hypothetical protein